MLNRKWSRHRKIEQIERKSRKMVKGAKRFLPKIDNLAPEANMQALLILGRIFSQFPSNSS